MFFGGVFVLFVFFVLFFARSAKNFWVFFFALRQAKPGIPALFGRAQNNLRGRVAFWGGAGCLGRVMELWTSGSAAFLLRQNLKADLGHTTGPSYWHTGTEPGFD